jgi:tetratricopeptide (TPR) repeat protein
MKKSLLIALFLGTFLCGSLWSQAEPAQIQEWTLQGNQFLEQGLYASARREYQKVLDAIPPQQRPATLQRVARCYYLQGNLQAAIITLKRAALLAPTSKVTRQLLVVTMENDGRAAEAEAWLARLHSEGPAALAKELGADPPTDELQLHRDTGAAAPPEIATPHRQGSFRTSFTKRSPLSSVETYRDRYDRSREEMVQYDPAEGKYDLASESFEVFVPDTYSSEKPHGLIVWVSPANSGGLGRPANLKVLADENLIWIGANNSGNDRWQWYRTGLALDAAHNMKKLYNIDPKRIYIAGYSGGGRIASSLAILFPRVFKGGAYFFGCNYFRQVAVPDKPSAYWRAGFPAPPPRDLARLRKQHRFVLVTGEHDFNRDETAAYFEEYKRDRFENVTYLEIPAADHGFGVEGVWLAQVVEALDAPLSTE